MSFNVEIETRYRVIDEKSLQAFLDAFSLVSEKIINDTYFDTQEGYFYQKGVFIRLRNTSSLDIKFNPEDVLGVGNCDHLRCNEYNFNAPFIAPPSFDAIQQFFPLKTASTFELFLTNNHLEPLVVLNKKRTTYDHPLFLIMVDRFENWGAFIEIESKSSEISEFASQVENLIQGLSLKSISQTGYVSFAVSETNLTLYQKGRYF